MTIKIVTDSTSDLPHDLAAELDITIIPLKVLFGTDEYRDGVDISTDEFFERVALLNPLGVQQISLLAQLAGLVKALNQQCGGDEEQRYEGARAHTLGVSITHRCWLCQVDSP